MADKNALSGTWIPQVVIIALLLFAFNPGNPYTYYIGLRWACFACFFFSCLPRLRKQNDRLALGPGLCRNTVQPLLQGPSRERNLVRGQRSDHWNCSRFDLCFQESRKFKGRDIRHSGGEAMAIGGVARSG